MERETWWRARVGDAPALVGEEEEAGTPPDIGKSYECSGM